MNNITSAAVLGSGSWGTALAVALADRGLDVITYSNRNDISEEINTRHTNEQYLPGALLPENIRSTTTMGDVVGCGLILVVVPSKVVRQVLGQLREAGPPAPEAIFLNCTKGIEKDSGKRMHELLAEFFPENPIAVLSGPSHAEEVAHRKATLSVIGCEDHDIAVKIQDIFTLPWFRTYTSEDVGGIETGATVKNIFAIAAGIIDGLGLGDNAKAAMITRGLAEMTRLGVALGGRPETFQGLSGIGDLMVTCYSQHSRNNRVGRHLGEGMTLEAAIAAMNQVAEGVPNTESVYLLSHRLGVRTPIIDQIYAILYQNKPASQALEELLTRDPRPEAED